MAKISGLSLAKLLGNISPKIKTIMVITTVATARPEEPKKAVKTTVAMDAAAILTMLLPMRIVDRALSKSSISVSTLAAFLLPVLAMFFKRILLHEDSAVSEEEKKADKHIKTNRVKDNPVIEFEIASIVNTFLLQLA